jgi:hypothetical protein
MKSKFDFKTGDIIRIPMYCSPRRIPGEVVTPRSLGLFIITDDNTNLGGYGPGSVEICPFPPEIGCDILFYRQHKHFKELKIEKVS